MKIILNPNSIEDYRKFLRIKTMPTYRLIGREAFVPDEYSVLEPTGQRVAMRAKGSHARKTDVYRRT